MDERETTEVPTSTVPALAVRTELAIWSVVAGLASLIFYFVALAGVPAVVLGSKAWNRLDSKSPYRWAAAAGIALGTLATLAWLGSLVPGEA